MDSKIMATILSIQFLNDHTIELVMSLGDKQFKFIFQIENDTKDPYFKSVIEEKSFSQVFKFNAPIAGQILRLLVQLMNNQEVEFPLVVGEFFTPEQAVAQQKQQAYT